jgi:hypothetical protein
MQVLTPFPRTVLRAATDELERRGFTRRRTGVFTCDLSANDVLGWVGLNRGATAPDGGHVLTPFIGVHDPRFEALFGELVGAPRPAFHGSVAVNLLEEIGDPRSFFEFSPERDPTQAIWT